MYNDADIEMANAHAEANERNAITSHDARRMTDDEKHTIARAEGRHYARYLPDRSLFSCVTDALADRDEPTHPDDADDIHLLAGYWFRKYDDTEPF